MRASVRPLARVEPQVSAEALPQRKCLGAHRAGVWFFPGVESLVPPQNLPVFERFPAVAAGIAVPGVPDDTLETPNAVITRGEAAEAVACVEALVATEVFGQAPTGSAVGDVVL